MKFSKLDWPSSHETWNNIISLIDSVDEICLTGGEPTLEKKQYEFFDKLIQADKAKQIQLKYNTNLTHLPPKLLNYWSKFKSIHLNVSIDATGDLNTYIRYPSEWEIIEKNLDLVRQIPHIYVKVNCTVQMYNILRLENLINWISKKENLSLNLNFLNHPRALNIKTLPIELKLETVKKLKSFLELAQINELVAYMMSEDTSQWLPEFYSYTEKLDQLRHENLFFLIPEFLEFKTHHAL